MIKPNWNIFTAKFNENPQNNFEWFCYLLFCKEFNKPAGIFRYKNHPIIETNPVAIGEDIIGWQAKFYESTLSSHAQEIKEILERLKSDYPKVNKLLFYTNQEWAMNKSKKPPAGQKEIEEKAKELGIEIVWNTSSFFESPFVSIDNELIAKYFFKVGNNSFDLIKRQREHTENILEMIQSTITFLEDEIKISREEYFDKLNTGQNQVTILSGNGGVGKTALIKDYYEKNKDNIPIYIFKATEFDQLRGISDFFSGYNFEDFLNVHEDEKRKIIIIDSAEKLLDIRNDDPFKEFLTKVLKNKWEIIFTTRENYIEDLNYLFFEIYHLTPKPINIQQLSLKELSDLSEQFNFALPEDQKLIPLLKNLFHLKDYLLFYQKGKEISYSDFKNKSWNRIVKNKPSREQCFLKIAFQRANEGQFFVNPNCESNILDDELKKDGILGYEGPYGYFITHDVYEEWALEKVIENEFNNKIENKTFLEKIGNSLPIRRAFRKWVSEKLLLDDKKIKKLIEEVIKGDEIASFWKDEILVSVLLSDYSQTFFKIFRERLLSDNFELLKKLSFLLRIACKEIDSDFFTKIGIKNIDLLTLKYVLTKPRGKGWESLVKFIFDNLTEIGIQNIGFMKPIFYEWNKKFQKGQTTRFAGLMALQYYSWIIEDTRHYYNDKTLEKLIETILYSSSEISPKLKDILDLILKNKWKNYGDPYFELSETILTKIVSINFWQCLPSYTIKIADLFWTLSPKKEEIYGRSPIGVDEDFGIEEVYLNYFPASAFQTPIYLLLRYSLKETADFILDFSNRAAKSYANSRLDQGTVKLVNVYVSKDKNVKQYISDRIWCTYRGTQVSPHVLESMHMALEKFFLETGKDLKSEILENWLFYLLEKSESASISAVVCSIVNAYPEKTFNVAMVLFRTKEFFFCETQRMTLDLSEKIKLQTIQKTYGSNNEKKIFEDERINSCDDKHRDKSLEDLFLQYQLFRTESTSKSEAELRQKELWAILDNYYKKLEKKIEDCEEDKTWRLYLARMDKRQMNITTQKTDEGILFKFKSELEPELQEYSDSSLEKISGIMKYSKLKMWATNRIERNESFKQFKQYEENPIQALTEVKEVISELNSNILTNSKEDFHSFDNGFNSMWKSVPGEVCAVLLRDFYDQLSDDEKEYCIELVLKSAKEASQPNYIYQISDGVEAVISVLPILFEKQPQERDTIKLVLLHLLFNDSQINMASTNFNIFPIRAMNSLWKNHFNDMNSILLGYLILKPIYIEYKKNGRYNLNINEKNKRWQSFFDDRKEVLDKVLLNKLQFQDVRSIIKIDLFTLRTAFQIIPFSLACEEHKELTLRIISHLVKESISSEKEHNSNYFIKHSFLENLALLLLRCQQEKIQCFLQPLIDNFGHYDFYSDFFNELILMQDRIKSYGNFWVIWNKFRPKIYDMYELEGWHNKRIVIAYLFARTEWKESAMDWHTFKEEDKNFFNEIASKIGHHPVVFFSLSKLLYGIGNIYLNDGMHWIANILKNNKNLFEKDLDENTLFYLENILRKHITIQREIIRKDKETKNNLLIILDFLVQKGSVIGYILRENIL